MFNLFIFLSVDVDLHKVGVDSIVCNMFKILVKLLIQ